MSVSSHGSLAKPAAGSRTGLVYLGKDKPMTHLYFEDMEVGASIKAGPYLVSKDEIVQFARQYDPVPRHIDEEAAARSILGDCRHRAPTFSRSSSC